MVFITALISIGETIIKEEDKDLFIIESFSSKEIINTSKYPLTNKGTSKWLVMSYLVPFLMYGSTDFSNRMSNFLFRLLSYLKSL
mgnify:CR=1 FL=1